MSGKRSLRAVALAVAIISAAVLAYQLLLMRLLSIVSWHHFAYMIISIALLGFGASGTVIALARRALLQRFALSFAACGLFFAVTAIGSFALAVRLPFNPLAIIWDAGQLVWLALTYGLLVLPFCFGGAMVGLAFCRFSQAIGRIYAYDLVGAGIGALGVIALLYLLPPSAVLRLVAALGLLSAALVLPSAGGRWPRAAAPCLGLLALLTALWLPPNLIALQPQISQFKGLALALRVPGARILEERSSPLGLISLVESPTVPLRHAPGLSLANTVEPPLQLGIFTDADSLSTITQWPDDLARLGYLDFTTAALPYHLLQAPKVLILGAGGGEQVLLALYHAAPKIDAVELDPQVARLAAEDYAAFAGGIYERPEVALHLDEARSFVRRRGERYDLIQMPLLTSFGAAAAGTQSLHESYGYTVEALQDYLARLEPGGMLCITLWLKLPPRDSLKLFATAVQALQRQGLPDPGARLALIRSWNTTTLLVKNGRLSGREIADLKSFAQRRSFDLAYYPGIGAAEANRFNILQQPIFFEAATALVGDGAGAYIEAYKFAIAPATDDRPFFYDFFKWRSLPELLALGPQGAAAMLDMGYLILLATLVQALLLTLLLILLPLAWPRRRFGGSAPRAGTVAYFLALGLAFLFIEIALIQRFIVFLGHPLHAVAVVLAGMLVFAGLGSACAPRLDRRLGPESFRAIAVAVAGIGTLALIYLLGLPPLFRALIALPDLAKIALSLLLIAPLAFCMGMPFPLGLARVAATDADLVPWAWGINGCASVVAAILATLLAIDFGFTAVVAIAVGLYAAAPLALRSSVRRTPDRSHL